MEISSNKATINNVYDKEENIELNLSKSSSQKNLFMFLMQIYKEHVITAYPQEI